MSDGIKNFSGYDPEACSAWTTSWLDPVNAHKDVRTRSELADAAERAVIEGRKS